MTTSSEDLSFRAVPAPGFMLGCTTNAWMTIHPAGEQVAHILIGHHAPRRPGETAESIDEGLRSVIDAMNLRPASEWIPIIEPRLRLHGSIPTLDFGHPTFSLRLRDPGAAWREHAAARRHVCIVVPLDYVPIGAGPDSMHAFIDRVTAANRAYYGMTKVRP